MMEIKNVNKYTVRIKNKKNKINNKTHEFAHLPNHKYI